MFTKSSILNQHSCKFYWDFSYKTHSCYIMIHQLGFCLVWNITMVILCGSTFIASDWKIINTYIDEQNISNKLNQMRVSERTFVCSLEIKTCQSLLLQKCYIQSIHLNLKRTFALLGKESIILTSKKLAPKIIWIFYDSHIPCHG